MTGRNVCTPPSFGARIVNTPYFENGLSDVMKKGRLTFDEKLDFLNAIEQINNDNSFDEFVINSANPRRQNCKEAQIMLDGKMMRVKRPYEVNQCENSCVRNIINFANERYGGRISNLSLLRAKQIAEDIFQKKEKLTDFINNNLIKIFGKSVYNLPNSTISLAETYSEDI